MTTTLENHVQFFNNIAAAKWKEQKITSKGEIESKSNCFDRCFTKIGIFKNDADIEQASAAVLSRAQEYLKCEKPRKKEVERRKTEVIGPALANLNELITKINASREKQIKAVELPRRHVSTKTYELRSKG
jgi:hypothetical protein